MTVFGLWVASLSELVSLLELDSLSKLFHAVISHSALGHLAGHQSTGATALDQRRVSAQAFVFHYVNGITFSIVRRLMAFQKVAF